MPKKFFNKDKLPVLEAQFEAQKIAFAPIVFQVARSLRDLGILQLLQDNKTSGLCVDELSQKSGLTCYALKVMLETALSANIVNQSEDRYSLTRVGFFLLNDTMTRVNMDYTHYVNYLGLYELDKALQEGRPAGLKVLGPWDTIYEGLSQLPDKIKEAWFTFDHYYSDTAYADATNIIKKLKPKKVLDIGGNTGKFARYLIGIDLDVEVTIFDLPGQCNLAQKELEEQGSTARIDVIQGNVLDQSQKIPKGYDLIWMSQFLDCFGEDDITMILRKVRLAMDENTTVCIMEPLWDRQRYETAAYCIINTSPYFTAMANGCSKLYHSEDLIRCIEKAGLQVVKSIDNLGVCQSILVLTQK